MNSTSCEQLSLRQSWYIYILFFFLVKINIMAAFRIQKRQWIACDYTNINIHYLTEGKTHPLIPVFCVQTTSRGNWCISTVGHDIQVSDWNTTTKKHNLWFGFTFIHTHRRFNKKCFLVTTHSRDQAVGIPSVRDAQTNSFSFRNGIVSRKGIWTVDILGVLYTYFFKKNCAVVGNENSLVHVF